VKRPRPSLRGRVIITGTLVIAVLVGALNAFVYVNLRDQLYSNLETVLDARAQLVIGLRDELSARELSDRLDEGNIRAVVRTPDGQAYRSAGAPDLFLLPPASPDEPLASRSVPLPGGGVATVLASRGGIDATLERLLLLAITGTLAVVVLAYAVFARLAARVLRPVREVANTARHIAGGEREQRLASREDDDELQGMVVAFNDMLDELEEAIERSQQAEELSRRFLADAAHQLRTPAAGIRASVATMARTYDPEDRERMIDNLAAESARMSRLLSSLLRVARLDSKEPPAFAPTPLREHLEAVIERQAVRAPRLRFELEGAEEIVAEVDASAIEEAVGNLLDNAAKHADEEVEVALCMEATDAVIRVTDDGPGVPPEHVGRVFDRFTSFDERGGSGLGLPIARGIATAHGGSLTHGPNGFVLRVPLRRRRPG
jgi:two-component system, OmpR family, sensor kinase